MSVYLDRLIGIADFIEGFGTGLQNRFKKDGENIVDFVVALNERVMELNPSDMLNLIADLEKLGRTLGECIPDPRKFSIGWLWGYDPFKPFRLEADRIAKKYQIRWSR